MNTLDFPILSAADIRAVEARAHQLRSEAMHNLLQSAVRAIAALPRKFVALVHRPSHA